jgi:hypothetical protein
MHVIACVAIVCVAEIAGAYAQEAQNSVTVENFPRAESDMYMGDIAKGAGGTGRFLHHREPASIDNQTIIRMNRDTLYSAAILDLDAGPVTITLPDSGKRFMSLQIVDEDHYAPIVVYAPAQVNLTRDKIGTRYPAALVRTLVDPKNPDDLKQVNALQDAIKIDQNASGQFEAPNWDRDRQKKIRETLLVLAQFTSEFKKAFGARSQVDPVAHLIGTAAGWGGNPASDATYVGAPILLLRDPFLLLRTIPN